jgi:hypothetical protein
MEAKEKNHHLTEKQEVARKEFMKQLEDEIDQLEFDIDHINLYNRKIRLLRGLKTSLRLGQMLAPYVLATGITLGAFAHFDKTPFVINDCKRELQIRKEIDSLGNIRCEEQYDRFNDTTEYFTYYGKWKQNEDGFYSREVRDYNVHNITEESVMEIIDNMDTISLDDLFGGPSTIRIEKKNFISKEEKDSDAYFQTVVFSRDENDYIIAKEKVEDNIAYTVAFLFCNLGSWKITDLICKHFFPFDFGESVRNIRNKYPTVYKEELQSKLKIKKRNYERLTRD